MGRKHYTPEQIIRKLREAEVELAKGQSTAEVARKLGIAEQTCYRNPIEGAGGAQKPRRRVPTFASSGTDALLADAIPSRCRSTTICPRPRKEMQVDGRGLLVSPAGVRAGANA